MKGTISMSLKETERINVMENLKAKKIKQKDAAKQLGISVRQVRRVLKRFKQEGISGLIHQNRGKKSHRLINQAEKDRAISLIKQYYPDFGPTFALEKLKEKHKINFSVETLRKEMISQQFWLPKKRQADNLHPYRERRACVGELVQLDGSPYAWFEDRASSCTLLAFIDDATSQVMGGEFVDHEGTFTFFRATKYYLLTYGKPLSFYVDKHSTFKVNRQATVEEELKDKTAQSQFSRAMDDLNITVIFAHSPQAKGRVERLFGTLQDRLVKELRLEGISTKEKATRYFREVYLPKHNAKFAVLPKNKANLHRPLLPTDNLERIFTLQSKRIASKDLIVQYKNIKYKLLPENGYRYTLRNTALIVEEKENGAITFRYKDKAIPYMVALPKVDHQKSFQVVLPKEKRVYIPGPNHPWRRPWKQYFAS